MMDTRTSSEWEDSDYRAATDASLFAFEEFEVPEPGDDLNVDDAFDSPSGDEGDVQYWVWDGNRLVPASPNKLARIHELEALDRLQALAKKQAAIDAADASLARVHTRPLTQMRRVLARIWTTWSHRGGARVTATAPRRTRTDMF